MKLESKFFDRLRVKPDENRILRDVCPQCEAKGCEEPGLYPAPKGRGHEGEYHRFCLDHVREYNKSYNYFSGLPDEDVAKHQKDDATGHRPVFDCVTSPARSRGGRVRLSVTFAGSRRLNRRRVDPIAVVPAGFPTPLAGTESQSPHVRTLAQG